MSLSVDRCRFHVQACLDQHLDDACLDARRRRRRICGGAEDIS